MRIFVATRAEDVPADAHPFVSVDGSVPGAVATWDHHVTGEPVNLDAMPDHIDRAGIHGVGTTLADTDAAASVLAVLAGGRAALPPDVRALLYAASYRCDHLRRAPGASDEADATGDGLHRWVMRRVTTAPDVSAAFEQVCRELAARLASSTPFPSAPPDTGPPVPPDRIALGPSVATFDLRGIPAVDPAIVHAAHDRPLALIVRDHAAGGVAYTVGVNPFVADAPVDLAPVLAALARAEHAHGPPCVRAEPGPGSENWGGRATVFGSPWNYGSRLTIAEVADICEAALTPRSAR